MSVHTHTTCNWAEKSGKQYPYYVHPIGASFKKQSGNYIYCKQIAFGRPPQYIGQTKNLNQRLGDHGMEACARRNGGTPIHARLNSTEFSRLAEVKDLILAYRPTCNEIYAG